MIEKKDWQSALSQFENLLVNSLVNVETYQAAIEMLKKKVAEFPVEEKEKDDMPEGLKEDLKDIAI